MTALFHKLEGEAAILRSNGVFTQTDLYVRDNVLFAKRGSGFVRLLDGGNTSHPSTFWEGITVASVSSGPHGRLSYVAEKR